MQSHVAREGGPFVDITSGDEGRARGAGAPQPPAEHGAAVLAGGDREHGGGRRGTDLLEIEALGLRCIIGCSQEERRDRSDVVIDLRIACSAQAAAASDDLADAWNYRPAVKAVIAHVEASAYRTVEALATAIARILVVDHHAPYTQVRVRKPGALRFAGSAGVVIERTPADFTAEVQP
jgi:FolB domain-containing protein